MAKKFSISDGMLNSISKNVKGVNELEARESFKVEYIDLEKIETNKKNFYEIVNIEELAEDIKANGLNHNLVVRKKENKYELLSGERRYTALKSLVEQGEQKFKIVPCKVVNVNDTDAEIILIQSNAQTRELTETEKLEQIQRLNELYKDKKARGEKIPGRVRDLIAKNLNMSPTSVGRYETINKNLIKPLKELIDNGSLTIANASEFASLSEENQKALVDLVGDVNLTREEAKKLKSNMKKIEEEKEKFIKEEKEKLKNELEEKVNEKVNEKLIEENNKSKELEEKLKKEKENNKIKEDELIKKIELEAKNKYNSELEKIKKQAEIDKKEKERLKKEKEELKKNNNKEKEKIESLILNKTIISQIDNLKNNLKKTVLDEEIKIELKKLISKTEEIKELIK